MEFIHRIASRIELLEKSIAAVEAGLRKLPDLPENPRERDQELIALTIANTPQEEMEDARKRYRDACDAHDEHRESKKVRLTE